MITERQLLQVWNPLIEPLTIKFHVDALLTSGSDPVSRWTWWGRVYLGKKPVLSADAARANWPAVADVADELNRTDREAVLLTTNFQSLHACRVDRIVFGDSAARADGARVPAYIRERKVAIWFRVRDVRPLSHDQRATLEWLDAHTRVTADDEVRAGGFGPFPFDPYRAYRYHYPVVVSSLPTVKLFDPSLLADCPPEKRLWAAQPGAVHPPDLEGAMATLRRDLDPPWSMLDDAPRVFLASATLIEAFHDVKLAKKYAMEPSAAMMLMAKAVEGECRAALGAVRDVAARARNFQAPQLGALERMTLGEMARLVPELKPVATTLRLPALASLAGNAAWREWLEDFAETRNRAAHAEKLVLREFERHREAIFTKRTSRLGPLIGVKREARNALS
jgi:hypothetical protein